MQIQIIYNNGDYESFSTPPLPYDGGDYVIDNTFLNFSGLLFAKSSGDAKLTLERSYWSVGGPISEEEGMSASEGMMMDAPYTIVQPNQIPHILAIIVDGMTMVARSDGTLRHWLDPLFVYPTYEFESMTGKGFPPTILESIAMPEGVPQIQGSQTIHLPDMSCQDESSTMNHPGIEAIDIEAKDSLEDLEDLFPGINELDEG